MRKIFVRSVALTFALLGAFACGSDRDGGPDDGSRNDDAEERCATAKVDDSGLCRGGDGRFAAVSCCIANEMCENATFDGDVCRAPDGKFAPASCCADLCEGASLDKAGNCRLPDGKFAFEACCADQCLANQAGDFDSQGLGGSCTSVVEGSNACGTQASDGPCFCDEACAGLGDCCSDKLTVCGGIDPATVDPFSCENVCGGSAVGGSCFCDDQCSDLADCCPNKVEECGGEGSATPLCEDVQCEGAEVDASGACRKPNGQFAKSSCCANAVICGGATIDDGGFCRRPDNGQFAPAVCCEGLCSGSFIDRDGKCRNADGEFALSGCCADACVERQGRSERTDRTDGVEACN